MIKQSQRGKDRQDHCKNSGFPLLDTANAKTFNGVEILESGEANSSYSINSKN